jgi:hypothetical protein
MVVTLRDGLNQFKTHRIHLYVLRVAIFIVRRTVLYIWQISDSVTILINTHPTETLF